MKDYTLAQQYALVGLNGLESIHMDMAKSAAIRAIAMAQSLERFLSEDETGEQLSEGLEEILSKTRKQKKKESQALEREIVEHLKADGVLEEVPNLLACDMYYYTAGVNLREYRCDPKVYMQIVEHVRKEALEGETLTLNAICLLWLFRESGCMHDIFSVAEQKKIEEHMIQLGAENEVYRLLWQSEFHKSLENMVSNFLQFKKNIFRNPYLEGVNMLYPFLDRKQSIFIDFVVLGTTVENRRMQIMNFLSERGHYVEEIKSGNETLLKVDNAYYRVFPTTVVCKFPIQGARLLPVYK